MRFETNNKVTQFCHKLYKTPSFDAVLVFSMLFVALSLGIPEYATDNGIICSSYDTEQERARCIKIGGVYAILAFAIPLMGGLAVYSIARKSTEVKVKQNE